MLSHKSLAATLVVAIVVPLCLIASRSVRGGSNPDDTNLGMAESQRMEQNFFKNAASDNTLEIRLAKLAQDRATDPQVKQIAQMMQKDHEDANALLQKLGQQYKIDFTVDELNPVGQAVYNDLQQRQGDQFTRMYVFQQVGLHAQDQLILAYHANNSKSPASREYSSQILPRVEMHLQSLEQIARPMSGLSDAAQPAAERMSPMGK